ncbi:DNA polymerase III subunit gamma and tau [Pseudarthrobacter sp. N5]|uniref:DNA polymerase III subunit gamma and tau n=1 Tax=Pseudarthrobacter sp. N5 TaxID=3418416 RepID=UPI003CEE1C22
MTVTTALYRRYRPDSFADVIGQEHVTEPLMTALRKNRVNHAYLFSGPRGCGKTTSARILARCLNCAEGPTDTPCGKCPSCIELARGGSGSLDVIEIDAASHGGVDDARDLRERATYAPVRDRYKIFIIDEAHMVTPQGFNALLKIVEEPPEHIKFIFATTEPDKVIGTIKSRTHHYPFRLVPPEPLMAYLELLCSQENVPVAPGVLSLVIRAGGGSVRDSLSVLDQLMAGAGADGLNYELAVALLGYTHASLLDDVIEAVAASDSATVFRAVDRVIQTGHDPRRFVEDLLERFRDLIIVQAMPESAQSILRGMPADQIARLQNQAHNLGASELSRAADVTNTALTEMTGATSPRLHLELLCARILLPSSEQTERGIAARIDRVERRMNYAGNDVGAPAAAVGPAPAVLPAVSPSETAGSRQARTPETPVAEPLDTTSAETPGVETRQPLVAPRVSTSDWPVDEPAPNTRQKPEASGSRQARSPEAAPAPMPEPAAASPVSAPLSGAGTGAGPAAEIEVIRRAWPEILQRLAIIKRSSWSLIQPNSQPRGFDGQTLTLAFTTEGLAGTFSRGVYSDNLRKAIHDVLGLDCQIVPVAGGINSAASSEPNPKAPASRAAPVTSTDTDWGLTPVEQSNSGVQANSATAGAGTSVTSADQESETRAAPVHDAPTPAHAPAPGSSSAKVAVTEVPEAVPVPGRTAVTEAPAALAADVDAAQQETSRAEPPGDQSGQGHESSGSYSYPDDDWGPPRDEDAPPLDEEPPLDWDPSAPVPSRQAAADTAAPAKTAGTKTAAARKTAAKDRSASGSKSAKTAGATAAKAGAATTGPPTPDVSKDAWARATEQAPGIWLTGTETNVGAYSNASAQATESVAAAEDGPPYYAPATAQIPPIVPAAATPVPKAPPAPQAAADQDPWAAPAQGSEQTSASPAPDSAPAPAEAPVTAPVYATMASAAVTAPVYAMAAAQTQPGQAQAEPAQPGQAQAAPPLAAVTTTAASATRQSLYQRLSNSPEAEAGRAKAPARTAASGAKYVQDVPSADDETIEESGVFGRAAVERILGGKLIEERSLDGSPLTPRF